MTENIHFNQHHVLSYASQSSSWLLVLAFTPPAPLKTALSEQYQKCPEVHAGLHSNGSNEIIKESLWSIIRWFWKL